MASGTGETQDAPLASVGRPPALRVRLRRSIDAHLDSNDVGRVIYGAIIGLALLEALDEHPPPSGVVAATLVVSALAFGLAEAYSEFVAADVRTHRPADRPRVRRVVGQTCGVVFGAGFPAV